MNNIVTKEKVTITLTNMMVDIYDNIPERRHMSTVMTMLHFLEELGVLEFPPQQQ